MLGISNSMMDETRMVNDTKPQIEQQEITLDPYLDD
jgi:hypothetical protein